MPLAQGSACDDRPATQLSPRTSCTAWPRQPSVHFGATGWLRFGWDRRTDTTTANGHRACDPAATRSARPILWPLTSCSTKNQARNTRSVQAAAADACGRRRTGTVRPGVSGYFQANAGHIASETKAAVAAAVCAEEERSPAGSGNAATRRVAKPPSPRTSLPAALAQPSALPVARCERPTPTKAPVISHRWGVSCAARSLIVRVTASKCLGCMAAARVQPPMSNSGAAMEDTRPHHGTRRTKAPYAAACPGTTVRSSACAVDDQPWADPSEVMARGAARVTTCVASLPRVVTTEGGWPPCRRSGTSRSQPLAIRQEPSATRSSPNSGLASPRRAWRVGSAGEGVGELARRGLPPEWLNQRSQRRGAPSQSRMVVALLRGAGLCVRDR